MNSEYSTDECVEVDCPTSDSKVCSIGGKQVFGGHSLNICIPIKLSVMFSIKSAMQYVHSIRQVLDDFITILLGGKVKISIALPGGTAGE